MKNLITIFILSLLLFHCATREQDINSLDKTLSQKSVSFAEKSDYILRQYLSGNYEMVITEIEKIKQEDPEIQALLSYIKGLSYFNLGLYNLALSAFLEAEASLPLPQELYNNIGITYYYLGDYTLALEYLHKAYLIDPSYKIAIDNYYIISTKFATSKADFKDITLIPQPFSTEASAYLTLGWFHYYLDNYPEAIYNFKKAIEVAPDYVMGYMALGILYDSSKNYKSALKYYQQAIVLDSRYPDLWNNIGITYYHLEMRLEAETSFLKAIELNNQYPHPYNNLGFFYLYEDKNKAKSYFEKAISFNNYYPELLAESYSGLALISYLEGHIKQAEKIKKIAFSYNFKLKNTVYLKEELAWSDKLIDIFLNQIP